MQHSFDTKEAPSAAPVFIPRDLPSGVFWTKRGWCYFDSLGRVRKSKVQLQVEDGTTLCRPCSYFELRKRFPLLPFRPTPVTEKARAKRKAESLLAQKEFFLPTAEKQKRSVARAVRKALPKIIGKQTKEKKAEIIDFYGELGNHQTNFQKAKQSKTPEHKARRFAGFGKWTKGEGETYELSQITRPTKKSNVEEENCAAKFSCTQLVQMGEDVPSSPEGMRKYCAKEVEEDEASAASPVAKCRANRAARAVLDSDDEEMQFGGNLGSPKVAEAGHAETRAVVDSDDEEMQFDGSLGGSLDGSLKSLEAGHREIPPLAQPDPESSQEEQAEKRKGSCGANAHPSQRSKEERSSSPCRVPKKRNKVSMSPAKAGRKLYTGYSSLSDSDSDDECKIIAGHTVLGWRSFARECEAKGHCCYYCKEAFCAGKFNILKGTTVVQKTITSWDSQHKEVTHRFLGKLNKEMIVWCRKHVPKVYSHQLDYIGEKGVPCCIEVALREQLRYKCDECGLAPCEFFRLYQDTKDTPIRMLKAGYLPDGDVQKLALCLYADEMGIPEKFLPTCIKRSAKKFYTRKCGTPTRDD